MVLSPISGVEHQAIDVAKNDQQPLHIPEPTLKVHNFTVSLTGFRVDQLQYRLSEVSSVSFAHKSLDI